MGDDRSREGNGAVVAIVVGLGIIVLLGVFVVFGGAFIFLLRASPPVQVTVAATPIPAPVQLPGSTAPAGFSAPLPIEVDSTDQILMSGAAKSLDELKQTCNEIKNGNSAYTEIKIKFAGSSDEKTQEVFLVLKETGVLYEVDPAGKIPAESADAAK